MGIAAVSLFGVGVGLCLCVGALSATAAGGDAGASLTLAEALAIFHARGFDLVIADAAVQSAAADLDVASAIPNPSAIGGISHSWFENHLFETHTGYSFGLSDSNSIEDTLSGKRGLRRAAARAALSAAKMQRADAQRALDLQVKQAYFQVAAATATVALAGEAEKSAEETFRLNQVRYRSGAISEVDLSKTETAKLEAEQALDSALESRHRASVVLGFWLGDPVGSASGRSIDARGSGFFSPPAPVSFDEPALIVRALAARPDLLGQLDEETRASEARKLAARLRFPDIGLSVEYQQQGSASGPNPISPPTLMLNLTATLPVFYQQQGEVRRAEADLQVQHLRRAKLAAQVVADVRTALEAYRTARRLVDRMQDRLLDRAERARDLVRLQYEKGAASLLEFLDGQRSYIVARNEYIQDLSSYWNAVFELEAATASELAK